MSKWLQLWPLLALLMAAFCGTAAMAGAFQVSGAALAGIQLPSPENNAEKEYLGVSGRGTFSLSQVKAQLLIIELFSMYCPHCQREAPVVNELHALIEKDASSKKDVKLVGIGIGNTPFEVDVFRKKFNVLFPLFADDDFQLEKISTDQFRTPTFIVAEIGPGSSLKILDVHVGPIKNVEEFLTRVKKSSGGK
jgi:thiol-disulfide isomerase/thioredoxin